ncbi:MAG: hypothetical protein KIT80_21825 [Chitinophagaceae bacterium]|nr:hypothetical protein [Chitinophagaceae bacterium]MCW5929575.1 hypothetical protein [Chitinophagaceae bacterium]
MKQICGLVTLFVFLISCDKDKYESRPSLKFKEMSGNYLPKPPSTGQGYVLFVTLEYTDAEGDLAGIPIMFEKKSFADTLCLDPDAPNPSYIDTASTIFSFPTDLPPSNNQKGEITIRLTENQFQRVRCANAIDSIEQAVFKFWFRDAAGNASDTATTEPITIEK